MKDGAVIFLGRLTRDPNDIRVFGRAIAIAYLPGRDDATQADIGSVLGRSNGLDIFACMMQSL